MIATKLHIPEIGATLVTRPVLIDKGDYYYEARIPAYKKFVAKKVSDKIINQFD